MIEAPHSVLRKQIEGPKVATRFGCMKVDTASAVDDMKTL